MANHADTSRLATIAASLYLMGMANDDRLDFPATGRNTEPILEVLRELLPPEGLMLEVASGSGQHVARFAAEFPGLTWQPTDLDPEHRRSISAWARDMANVLEPLELDASANPWPVEHADAVICVNMIHIAPWTAGLGLLEGTGRILAPGGMLYLYGPYMIDNVHTAKSNARFDECLKSRDPSWGLRDLGDVIEAAAGAGLILEKTVEMPANNLSVIFRNAI